MPSDFMLMLEQAWLIAVREYQERVRSRAFVLTTVLTPLLMGALLGGSVFLAMHTSGSQRIAVAGNDPALTHAVAAELQAARGGPQVVDVVTPAPTAAQDALNRRIADKSLTGYLLLVPQPASGSRAAADAQYISGSSADIATGARLESALGQVESRRALQLRGISAADTAAILHAAHVSTQRLRDGKLVSANNAAGFAGAYGLVFLLYLVVLIYGMNVARSVVQEKTSRIYEVLLATASADSLIAGKLLGVGAAGLTQVAIWFGLLAAVSGSSVAATYGLHGLASLGVSGMQVAFFLIFFLLGFLFYSAISAAVGAMLGAEQELQQFSIVIVAPLAVAMMMLGYVLTNPSAPVSVWFSLIPPFTPIIMYLRICAQMPPMWQVELSIALLVLSIVVLVWLAARIYRVGILMYGKRPTLPEILRWVRQS